MARSRRLSNIAKHRWETVARRRKVTGKQVEKTENREGREKTKDCISPEAASFMSHSQ